MNRKWSGFSLVELMVALAIVAIIAAIAYPSYQNQVTRTRRADAMGAMMQAAQALERYKSANNFRYTGATLGAGGVFTNQIPVDGGAPQYTLTLAVTPTTYLLTATPVPGTTQDGDGVLTLDQSGNRTWNGKNCWPTSSSDC
jgi:type IV pilus assembly protein PilE